jgi:hypothetical protein
MQISHALNALEQQLAAHLRFADPEQVEIVGELVGVLTPAIRQSMLQLVEAAATEVNSQLSGQRVDVRLVDGEPELIVSESTANLPPPPPGDSRRDDDDEARITLRIPSYLKDIIADAASGSGDSVNSWVVEAVKNRTATSKVGNEIKRTIQL